MEPKCKMKSPRTDPEIVNELKIEGNSRLSQLDTDRKNLIYCKPGPTSNMERNLVWYCIL